MRGPTILLLFVALSFSCIETNKEKRLGEKSIYSSVDKQSETVPDSLESASDIAAHLARSYAEQDEKVRAIHIWVSHNIRYDTSMKIEDLQYESNEEIAAETLETKKGVCFHYAELFDQMCRSVGIESFVIDGYTRDRESGKIADVGHSWNAVKIGTEYYLVDNTWAAGYVKNDSYIHDFRDKFFLVEPRDFIKNHMPFDYIWQFLDNPIAHIDFKRNDFSKLDHPGNYVYEDSIKAHYKWSRIDRLIRENERIQKAGVANNLIEQKLNQTNGLIESVRYNDWVRQFNEITNDLNKASKDFNRAVELNNEFIRYLNRRSAKTELEEEEMRQVISKAVKYYRQGRNSLKKAGSRISQLEYYGREKNRKGRIENQTKRLRVFILELEMKFNEVKQSLRLHALHADIDLS